jgi:hypothetical protein
MREVARSLKVAESVALADAVNGLRSKTSLKSDASAELARSSAKRKAASEPAPLDDDFFVDATVDEVTEQTKTKRSKAHREEDSAVETKNSHEKGQSTQKDMAAVSQVKAPPFEKPKKAKRKIV